MWHLKALTVKIQANNHAEQQLGHEVRIVMPQLTGVGRLCKPRRKSFLHANHAFMEDLLRLAGEPVRFRLHQTAGL